MAPISKKRRLNARNPQPVEKLEFDISARQDYLTGFHKRKQARIESAREAAQKREREEKVKERKALREQRKEELEQHVAAVNDELRKQNAILNGDSEAGEDTGEEFEGFDEESSAVVGAEQEVLPSDEEYVDEDRYTTVTVEAMGDPDAGSEVDEQKLEEKAASGNTSNGESKKKRPWTKDGSAKSKPKKKKFRYETKAERTLTRQKQKSKKQSKDRAAQARRKGT